MEPAQLEILANKLADTFPATSDAPLARALLTELAVGAPVTLASLSNATRRPTGVIRAALRRWPNVHYDDHGAVIAFSGLSLTPTAHRFCLPTGQLFTWCAWDTLFLPALLNRLARIESTCPITGAPIELSIDPNGIDATNASDLWVSFPDEATTSTANIVTSFCCHVHFLAGKAAAHQWLHKEGAGHVLELADAHALGLRATEHLR
jgi:alkylmercury lyase